jgi:hypothetical protein
LLTAVLAIETDSRPDPGRAVPARGWVSFPRHATYDHYKSALMLWALSTLAMMGLGVLLLFEVAAWAVDRRA